MESADDGKGAGRRKRDDVFDQTYLNSRAGPLSLTNRIPFPVKLYQMLEDLEKSGGSDSSIVSWSSEGRAFKVFDKDDFVTRIMPRYFQQTRYKSFQRQLHLYGFTRILTGEDKGAYFHPKLQRRQKDLCREMVPLKRNTGRTPKNAPSQDDDDVQKLPSKKPRLDFHSTSKHTFSGMGHSLTPSSSMGFTDNPNELPPEKMISNHITTTDSLNQDPSIVPSALGLGLRSSSYFQRPLLEYSSNYASGINRTGYYLPQAVPPLPTHLRHQAIGPANRVVVAESGTASVENNSLQELASRSAAYLTDPQAPYGASNNTIFFGSGGQSASPNTLGPSSTTLTQDVRVQSVLDQSLSQAYMQHTTHNNFRNPPYSSNLQYVTPENPLNTLSTASYFDPNLLEPTPLESEPIRQEGRSSGGDPNQDKDS